MATFGMKGSHFFSYAFFRPILHGFAQEKIGGKERKRAQGERGNVYDGVYGPAETRHDVPANDQGAGFGAYIEHVDVRPGTAVAEEIDAEGDDAEAEIDGRGGRKISEPVSGPAAEKEIQSDKDEDHVPGKGMQRQRPIGQTHTFGGEIGDETAHEAERGRKGIQRLPAFSGFEKGQYETGVHRHAAKLEGDPVEPILSVFDDKGIKELFIQLRKKQKQPDAEQEPGVCFFRRFSQQKGREQGERKPREPKDEMKGPVRLRRRHFPCCPFEKTDYDLHTGAPVVFCGASSLLVRFFLL